MRRSEGISKLMALYLWGVLLTLVSFVLGSIPLNAIFRRVGSGVYWTTWLGLGCLTFGFGLRMVGGSLLLVTVLVGLFNEAKRFRVSDFTAGIFSTGAIAGGLTGSFYYWAKQTGPQWMDKINELLQTYLHQHVPAGYLDFSGLKVQDLIYQMPSAIIIVLMVSLYLAVLSERRVLSWMSFKSKKRRPSLIGFKLPDAVFWLFVASLLFAFLKTEVKWLNPLGLNVLNVVLMLFFFQGLAIIVCYLKLAKASPFWRFLVYLIVVTQLFLVVSLLGILDFWVDFRLRMIRRSAELNKTLTN